MSNFNHVCLKYLELYIRLFLLEPSSSIYYLCMRKKGLPPIYTHEDLSLNFSLQKHSNLYKQVWIYQDIFQLVLFCVATIFCYLNCNLSAIFVEGCSFKQMFDHKNDFCKCIEAR